jgi:hypothetical protein
MEIFQISYQNMSNEESPNYTHKMSPKEYDNSERQASNGNEPLTFLWIIIKKVMESFFNFLQMLIPKLQEFGTMIADFVLNRLNGV